MLTLVPVPPTGTTNEDVVYDVTVLIVLRFASWVDNFKEGEDTELFATWTVSITNLLSSVDLLMCQSKFESHDWVSYS